MVREYSNCGACRISENCPSCNEGLSSKLRNILEGIVALVYLFRSLITLAFRLPLLPILASCSAGYGDDLIVTVISIQLSTACNILLRNRPWVCRYRIYGACPDGCGKTTHRLDDLFCRSADRSCQLGYVCSWC